MEEKLIPDDVKEVLDNAPGFMVPLGRAFKRFNKLKPYLDYNGVKEELDKMQLVIDIDKVDEDDLELFNEQLNLIQAYRDRATNLFSKAENEFNVFENEYIHLCKAWICHSKQGSDKKRESEAEYLFDFIFKAKEDRRSVYNLLKRYVENLNKKTETISRKASIIQEAHKVIGIMYSDNNERYKEAIQSHRETVAEKAKKFREENKGKSGWAAIPTRENLGI